MWFEQPIERRAPTHGIMDALNNRFYKGGEFLPFYVPRPIMPQIDEENYNDFLDFMARLGICHSRDKVAPETLRAHQRIDRIRAERMPEEVRRKRIFISLDGYILDGNHRWMMHAILHEPINVYRIGLPFEMAVEIMFMFPKTYSLQTTEERN